MKKYSAILFLILFLANGAGFYVFYVLQLYEIKAEMRESLKILPDEQLQILTLTEREYEESFVEEGEIKVSGKMYDIAKVLHHKGFVTVYCLHDELEDNLFALLNELVAKPLKDKNSIPQAIYEFLSLTFLRSDCVVYFPGEFSPIEKCSRYCFPETITFPETPTPPPQSKSC